MVALRKSAFKALYDMSIAKLDREKKRLRAESWRLQEKRQQLERRRAKLQKAIKDYDADMKLLGKKSKRSPDEGLFIDESVPKNRR